MSIYTVSLDIIPIILFQLDDTSLLSFIQNIVNCIVDNAEYDIYQHLFQFRKLSVVTLKKYLKRTRPFNIYEDDVDQIANLILAAITSR